ncbi:MAG: hypothetical protein FWE38_04890 [Firmicutes bacterium]|nr:hypothetical protein [Bacillota bacterium]
MNDEQKAMNGEEEREKRGGGLGDFMGEAIAGLVDGLGVAARTTGEVVKVVAEGTVEVVKNVASCVGDVAGGCGG